MSTITSVHTIIKPGSITASSQAITNTSYAYDTYQRKGMWHYDASKYDGTVTFRLEVVGKIVTGTLTCALVNTSNSVLASSAVDTTSSTTTNFGVNFTPTDNTDYYFACKASTGGSGVLYSARIIITQTGTVTKTVSHIPCYSYYEATPGTSYADVGYGSLFTYDSSKIDGLSAVYLETFGVSASHAYIQLVDTDGNVVTGSEVDITTTQGRFVSSDFKANLVNGKTYKIQQKRDATSGTLYSFLPKLVIEQSNFTKFQKYQDVCLRDNTTNIGKDVDQNAYWDDQYWDVTSKNTYIRSNLQAGSTSEITMTVEKADGTDLGSISTTQNSYTLVVGTTPLSPVDNTKYYGYPIRTSGSNNCRAVNTMILIEGSMAAPVTTISKTVTAKSRIKQAAIEKTVTAKTRIKNFVTKTVTIKTRIKGLGTARTITAKTDIKILAIEHTISAKANIIKMGPWDETRDYEIITGGVQFTETIQAKTNIIIWEEDSDTWNFVVNTPQTISAKTRVLKITSQTVAAKTRIFSTGTTKTIAAKVRVKIPSNTTTCSAKTRILSSGTIQTLQAKTRIKINQSKTATAKVRIKIVNIIKTITAKARIKKQLDKTITAKIRIRQIVEKTVAVKTRIKNTGTTKTITAKTCIVNTVSKTISAKVKVIYDVRTKTVTAKTRIKQQALSETVTVKVNILTINSKTVTARTRVKRISIDKTISAKTCIVFLRNQIIGAKTRILVVRTKTITTKARVKSLGSVKTIAAKTRIITSSITKTILAKTRIKQARIKTISAKALVWVRTLYTKTISAKVDIFNAVTQTVTAKTRVIYAPPQTVRVAHGVGMFNKIYDLEQGVVGNIVIIRIKSGKVHTVVINSN